MGNMARSGVLENSITALGQDRIGESPVGGIGSRRTKPRSSSRLTTRDRRDSDALVTTTRELILMTSAAGSARAGENLVLDHRQVGITLELLIN